MQSRRERQASNLNVVSVAQSVERRIVVPVVVGSIPITHPNLSLSPMGR